MGWDRDVCVSFFILVLGWICDGVLGNEGEGKGRGREGEREKGFWWWWGWRC